MLWNGGMLGLGFASFDSSILLPAVLWLAVGGVVAWALESSSAVWKLLDD